LAADLPQPEIAADAGSEPAPYAADMEPPPPMATPTPSGRKGALLAAVAVVVVVVIIVGLGFANVIPGFHLSPSSTTEPGSHGPALYVVTFTESGLPTGANWSVMLNGTSGSSMGTTITFSEPNGSYLFEVTSKVGATSSPTSGKVTVTGRAVGVPIQFTPLAANQFVVTFSEGGLPAGTSWTVTLNGTMATSSGTLLTFPEVNGTYPYSVGAVSGYSAAPSTGAVKVAGKPITESVTFTAVAAGKYLITFTESGLPTGTTWSATMGGMTGSASGTSFAFTFPNGTYPFSIGSVTGYTADPPSGTLLVKGAGFTEAIGFRLTNPPEARSYNVTFTQTVLPAGDAWDLGIAPENASYGSTLPTFGGDWEGSAETMAIPNGTYEWGVTAEDFFGSFGFFPDPSVLATPGNGSFTVAGHPLNLSVTFYEAVPTATNYTVTLTETGLPSTAHWFATVNTTNGSAAAGAPIVFTDPNGTYFFNGSTNASGYQPVLPFGGDLTVDGSAVHVVVEFAKTYTLWFNETGLGANAYWVVGLNWSEGSLTQYLNATYNYFLVTNGTYSYVIAAPGYQPNPVRGTVLVNGHSPTVSLHFSTVTTYLVTFTESGLPTGWSWYAELDQDGIPLGLYGSYTQTNSSEILFSLPDGNYTWYAQVNSQTGPGSYLASPFDGVAVVNGAPLTEHVTFSAVPAADQLVLFYEYTYSETGLYGNPNGTSWSVTLDGKTWSTSGMYLFVPVVNGTYSYSVTPPPGYTALPSSGSLTVSGDYPLQFNTAPGFIGLVFLSNAPMAPQPPGVCADPTILPVVSSSPLATLLASRPLD
jgi:hypothetical protein